MTIINGILTENEEGMPWLRCGMCGYEFFAKVGDEVKYPDECPKCKINFHERRTIEHIQIKGPFNYYADKGRESMQGPEHIQ